MKVQTCLPGSYKGQVPHTTVIFNTRKIWISDSVKDKKRIQAIVFDCDPLVSQDLNNQVL